ncbi:alpha/beta-hydrolase [Earliella scabrosa]|nr:alpha/beta-hydrolase [Earliella scabrosa]
MDPALYKEVKVRRGLTYRYYYSPADTGKPTLFFIHGFPSSSFEWTRQVAHFKPKGYGLLIPDCLGAGGTSKPSDYHDFRWKLQAEDLIDVLDAESPVIGIGHDWGSMLLSALAQHHQDRFTAFAWIALSYLAPGREPFDFERSLDALKEQVGSEVFGYQAFFNRPDAHTKCEQHIDSFIQLVYPATPETWIEGMCPRGKAQEWIEGDKQPGRAPWISDQEYATIRSTLLQNGLQSAMNFYKAYIADISLEDNKALSEEQGRIKIPALFVATMRDYVCRADFGKAVMRQWAPHTDVIELNTGHWAQYEATAELNDALEKWVNKVVVKS